jgi:TM2 domain-containing membrane protein YozV
MSRAGIAAVLSFLIPGLGQLYNGDFFRGLLWFGIAIVFHITLFVTTMGIASLLYHLVCAWAAYSRAESKYGKERRLT